MFAKVPIRVAAIFSPGGNVTPKWFELNRRKHEVTDVTYHWQDRVGDRQLLHYAVTDGEALYELVYDPAKQSWTVNSRHTE